jgi:hypothetical protein
MTEITDDFMRQMISRTKCCCIVILKAGPNRNKAGVERSFGSMAEGILLSVARTAVYCVPGFR